MPAALRREHADAVVTLLRYSLGNSSHREPRRRFFALERTNIVHESAQFLCSERAALLLICKHDAVLLDASNNEPLRCAGDSLVIESEYGLRKRRF